MTPRRLLIFFCILLRPTWQLVAVATLAIAYAVRVAILDPARFNELFAIVLLIQMFAASTGFVSHARRGHFDPALGAGTDRLSVAAAHACVAVVPGAALLVMLACIDVMANGPRTLVDVGPGALVAFSYVSAMAWAAGLPCRRFAAGVGWLLIIVIFVAGGDMPTLRAEVATQPQRWSELAGTSLDALIFPVFLIAEAGRVSSTVLAIVSAASVLIFAVGLHTVCSADVPLSE